jgi:cyclopropane fatty-acyl-phospholipid synthase-like methyltransferase
MELSVRRGRALARLAKLVRRLAGRGCTATDFAPVYSRAERDAWGYERRPFESKRFDLIMEVLFTVRAKRALEVGCAEGHLTRRLGSRVEELVACDIVEEALRRAQENCRGLDNARFLHVDVRHAWPPGFFDLLVYSDVLYYFTRREVRRVIRESARRVHRGGYFLFANEWHDHYRWQTHPDYVTQQLDRSGSWTRVCVRKYVDTNESRRLTVELWRRR